MSEALKWYLKWYSENLVNLEFPYKLCIFSVGD